MKSDTRSGDANRAEPNVGQDVIRSRDVVAERDRRVHADEYGVEVDRALPAAQLPLQLVLLGPHAVLERQAYEPLCSRSISGLLGTIA